MRRGGGLNESGCVRSFLVRIPAAYTLARFAFLMVQKYIVRGLTIGAVR